MKSLLNGQERGTGSVTGPELPHVSGQGARPHSPLSAVK